MKLDLITLLGNKLGILFIFAFILSRLKPFRNLIAKKNINISDKILLSVVFGIFGIVGTYFSFEYYGGLINTRIIGVATGGLIGGPLVGILSGLIAGLHRGFIDSGEFTGLACAISTVFEGLMAGIMGLFIRNKNNKWVYATLTGTIAELMRKVSVLVISKPFEKALEFVSHVWLPMVIINSVGLALLFMIIESIFKENEKMRAYQANITLETVDKALPFLKDGLCSENVKKVAKIIYEMTEFDLVKITGMGELVAKAGAGIEACKNSVSKNSDSVIKRGEALVINDYTGLNYSQDTHSVLILPLKENGKTVGTLELYRKMSYSLTKIDLEIGNGLAKLFSTQLTLNKLENDSKLLEKSELKLLQAQINPHFLFNSLTVISSLCRIDVEKSRKLIIHLSDFYRKSLSISKDMVDLQTEMNHVKSYVFIEMARFEDKIKIIYDVPENLSCFLPPLTLQPIVENAIKHGILPKKNGGTIKISGHKNFDTINLVVSDDGVGIEKNKLDSLFYGNLDQRDSVGFKNVDMRLKGIFGEGNGLKILSEKNKGTTVSLNIPMIDTCV
ncbi:LytS/YhcK type 5TM receptor domain-containing protein [uncultured Ilyobacter sp.]|uniref:LytS/YhcK type 5TM receptor domain-containing protein n=1 Tax=uncultured Ilyobacter sp. TaxID=544433 RepID=UPI0029C86640|nr:LytS/YhcK type 5TM receptor domain-containing protein [uncultured Ilyobacter sp.]